MIKYFLESPLLSSVDLRFERKTDGASGYDVMANTALERTIAPGARWFCPTGLYLEMPIGVEGQVRSRSGLARDHGVIVLNAPGTVDADYRGEIMVTLLNTDRERPYVVHPGARIAQIVFCPVFGQLSAIRGFHHVGDEVMRYCPQDEERPYLYARLNRVVDKSDLALSDRGAAGHGSTGV